LEIQIKKWGNSLGIRIPQAIANQINIKEGSKINLVLNKNKIELIPTISEYRLDDLIALINESNIHNEISTGEARGNEIW